MNFKLYALNYFNTNIKFFKIRYVQFNRLTHVASVTTYINLFDINLNKFFTIFI